MKRVFNFLVLPLILLVILMLYSFAGRRHHDRKIQDIKISFTDYSDPFISELNVNKLLIQKEDSVNNLAIENLDLNESETRLVADPMIRTAEVSVNLNGELQVVVEPRTPIARLMGDMTGYLDEDNLIMPLSKEHTALVPIVTGFKSQFQEQLYQFLLFVREDDVLQMGITQIAINKKGEVTLMLRSSDMRLKIGKLKNVESKMSNFKAMLAKIEKDKTVDQIESMDLRFDQQVIVVKK